MLTVIQIVLLLVQTLAGTRLGVVLKPTLQSFASTISGKLKTGERLFIKGSVCFVLLFLILLSNSMHPAFSREGQASPILYWGKAPNEAKIRQLKSVGVKSLICVRTNPMKKTSAFAESLGMKWFNVKTGVMLKPSKKEMAKFISIVGNRANQPVYVFCVGGRDRTTFYLALYRMAFEGWNIDQARAELRAHHLRRKWPIFWLYDDVLEDNSEWIKEFVAQHHYRTVETQAVSSRDCPCADIKFVDNDKQKILKSREIVRSARGISDLGTQVKSQ
jgi:protein tyrosine phosphatase (PTP) superfamily phosphohydrolase (DUF442 family)